MALQRGFRSRAPQRSRRKTAWGDGPSSTATPITSTGVQGWGTGVSLANTMLATIVRMRGLFSFYITGGNAAVSGFTGAVGIGVTSLDAFTAGVLPDPAGDAEWPGWLWHRFFNARLVTPTIADGVNAVSVLDRIVIDSKAMRKIGESEVVFGNVEITDESGVATATFYADTRMLLKLP